MSVWESVSERERVQEWLWRRWHESHAPHGSNIRMPHTHTRMVGQRQFRIHARPRTHAHTHTRTPTQAHAHTTHLVSQRQLLLVVAACQRVVPQSLQTDTEAVVADGASRAAGLIVGAGLRCGEHPRVAVARFRLRTPTPNARGND